MKKFLIIAVFTFSIIFLNSSNSFTCIRRISWWSYEKKEVDGVKTIKSDEQTYRRCKENGNIFEYTGETKG